jgi:hypothetical protein
MNALITRRHRGRIALVAAIVIVIAGIAIGLHRRAQVDRYPPIHDVTTSLTAPPAFRKLAVTPNAAQPVPDRGRQDMAGLSNDLKWRMWHVEAYGRLRPIEVTYEKKAVFARALEIAHDSGWTVALADPAGHIEATAGNGLFGGKDDVAIDIHKSSVSNDMIVDMRSVSRAGGGDGGRNAHRIERFLTELKGK